ncbi:hypothetical protein BASA60_004136 [Batrachochytrium salamandrivorans]|nr:hypothetical protein BASA60_004136 [Batrachochytrium salamandrivorans]
MGIPKFFRWISERYPLCSEIIQERRIPEFATHSNCDILDNLYLDMNGIIHNCSHPNDEDASFRITETQIFISIFSYIDHIFATIRPQKLFFLAVDGVAPRAKMNQQRARRFRSAFDAKVKKDIAIRKGEELPTEPPFDSNCITPGTPFMARLQEQLKYFLSKKVSEDAAWRNVQVVLSGHDVPGEGEHKIMEYIRLAKSRPSYPANLRHCLYGLDADLMMLGLLSHEPHFSLLREEVTFGRKKHSSSGLSNNPAEIKFFLLHLSLFREYLDLEFNSLKETLSFKYDLERIIDDFILLSFFIGNDFLPSLPDMHVNDGALPQIFEIYKTVLSKSSGYINNYGALDIDRCKALFTELGKLEFGKFKKANGDGSSLVSAEKKSRNSRATKDALTITADHLAFVTSIKEFVFGSSAVSELDLDVTGRAQSIRTFVFDIANELGLQYKLHAEDAEDGSVNHFISLYWAEDEDEKEKESLEARRRAFKKYDKATVLEVSDKSNGDADDLDKGMEIAFAEAKQTYYMERFGTSFTDQEKQKDIVAQYVLGIQWVLFYYYRGVQSWAWFFPYHFSPMMSDLSSFGDLKLEFEIGTPFFPFEQLMGVLPALSRQHIPPALQGLLVDANSPIIDFYPETFELDMNGKKSEWEAVVKIPFINERRLLEVYDVNGEERIYRSPLPMVFPDIQHCRTDMKSYSLPHIGEAGFLCTLCPGAFTGADLLQGFPSLGTIPYTAVLAYHGVNMSVIVTLKNGFEGQSNESIAQSLIGKHVFSGWPFLQEAMVVSISDSHFVYSIEEVNGRNDVVKTPKIQAAQDRFMKTSETIEHTYSKRFGTIIGPVDTIVHIKLLQDMKMQHDGSLVKNFGNKIEDRAIQTIVVGGKHEDPRYKAKPAPPIDIEFPLKSIVFLLTSKYYGYTCRIAEHHLEKGTVDLTPEISSTLRPNATQMLVSKEEALDRYMPSWQVAKQLGISSLNISRISSSLYILVGKAGTRFNAGLNLKFDFRCQKALGYTRKSEKGNNRDFYKDTDFFPVEEANSRIDAIKKWLVVKGIKNISHVSLTTRSLTKSSIEKLQELVDEHHSNDVDKRKAMFFEGIPRSSILKPSHSKFRLQHQEFGPGDRVKITVDEGHIPTSTEGTVVGIDGEYIEILLDKELMIATDLDGRCSKGRGAVVHKSTCINMSVYQPPPKQDSTERVKSATPKRMPTSNESFAQIPSSWRNGAPQGKSSKSSSTSQVKPSCTACGFPERTCAKP